MMTRKKETRTVHTRFAVSLGRPGRLQTGGADDAGAAEAAVAGGVLGEVLLVIVLGVVELGGVDDLGGDLVVTRRREPTLVRSARGLGHAPLGGRVHVDPRAVLGADVVALSHALGRVVTLPEDPQQ